MAARYFINGLVNSNWSSTSNWSTTSGGGGGSAVPTASDDVHFDANSPSCIVDSVTRAALTLDFTGYTNTITMNQQITVSGSVTLASAMTIAGSGLLMVNATATMTSNTKTWPNALTLSANAGTFTFADNWAVSGTLTISNTCTVNGFQISASGSVTTISSGTISGTTVLLLNGTGTLTGPNAGGLKLPLTINTAGTITFASAVFVYHTGTFTYVAGTVVTTGSTFAVQSANTTLVTAGIIWAAVTLSGAITVTLSNDLTLTGLLTLGSTNSNLTLTGQTINAGGGIRYGGTSATISGTTVLKLTNTGTVDAPSLTSGRILCSTVIDAGAGTITFSGSMYFDVGVLKYVSGTVITNATWIGAPKVMLVSGSISIR